MRLAEDTEVEARFDEIDVDDDDDDDVEDARGCFDVERVLDLLLWLYRSSNQFVNSNFKTHTHSHMFSTSNLTNCHT